MITFSSLGQKGNLGNQLFQIAATIGIAEKNNQEYIFPIWEQNSFFKNELPQKSSIDENNYELVREKNFHFEDLNLRSGNYDLRGWFQSEKYFVLESIKRIFTFKSSFLEPIAEKYSHLLNSKHIVISVRRGDFVNHPYYFQLSYKYYFLAVIKNFPDWESRNLIFTSDDISYCKKHFSFLKNSYFLEDLTPIEQLAFGSLSKDFVISNSTFSWWLAWLGEKEGSKIIRPEKNFRGRFAEMNDDKDYFPDRWLLFKVPEKLMNLKYFNLMLIGESCKIYNYCWHIYKMEKKRIKLLIKEKIVSRNG